MPAVERERILPFGVLEMSRQQKRAAERSVAKSLARRSVASAPSDPKSPLRKVLTSAFEDLNDRQRKGFELWELAQRLNGKAVPIAESTTYWASSTTGNTVYTVTFDQRNHRGKMVLKYRCTCPDFVKQGATDCKHIFAEKLRKGEVMVDVSRGKKPRQKSQGRHPGAKRRKARKRVCTSGPHKGKTVRTAQRHARIAMPIEIPQLIHSLKRTVDKSPPEIVTPQQPYRGGRAGSPYTSRVAALIAKISNGASSDTMFNEFKRMISDGILKLKNPPDGNRISEWLNSPVITPFLEECLRLTARPFVEREAGAIIDSSKVSQLMTASAMGVDYLGDKRPQADWMKCHALVGVESMVIMAVEFSGTIGQETHDINFLEPLILKATKTYSLQYLIADKAYLSEEVLKFLWSRGIKAAVPLKKGYWEDDSRTYHECISELVEWFDRNNNRDFHEFYRLRAKIEALFSLMKRMTGGYCWGRGRPRLMKSGDPCTAWKNEVLCKCIYMNLRTTVTLTHETGIKIDYGVPDRRFEAPTEPLIKRAA
ncbi:MAG TPA: transposase [Candidatus Acidoferrales bacterium]|nr:transposase [Candidatus Acidoferrales bacterium]